jgi:branched-chain amino acid transport system ATP-binding protein
MSRIEVEDVVAGYGPVAVLHGLSLTVDQGEIVAVLGANGAGKSTLMKSIVGLVKPKSGSIRLGGNEISRASTERTVRAGLTLVPEGRQIFSELTVTENLRLGAFSRRDRGAVARDVRTMLERFPRLGERSGQVAGTLSGGEQQQLAICRALMSRPTALLLDEPSLGLAPVMAQAVFDLVSELRAQDGLTLLLVEQSIHDALNIADRAYVMASGRCVQSGTTAEIASIAHELESSYLGGVGS